MQYHLEDGAMDNVRKCIAQMPEALKQKLSGRMEELKRLLVELDNVAAPTEDLVAQEDVISTRGYAVMDVTRNLQRFFLEFGQSIMVLVRKEGEWEVIFADAKDNKVDATPLTDAEFFKRAGIKPFEP